MSDGQTYRVWSGPVFPGRLGLQQRVLPAYRAPFFDLLAQACRDGLSVFAGQAQPEESIVTTGQLGAAQFAPAHNRHLLRVSSPFYHCWQSGLLVWLQTWQPQALVVEANPRTPSTWLAVRWMHARRRPVLGWGLGAPAPSGRLAAWRSHNRWRLLHALDGMIAYSRRGAQEFQALGIPPERIFVAPNAATPTPPGAPPERSPHYAGQPTVIFVGRLQARKRIDNLLYACASLPEALKPRLWVVGDGPARAGFEQLARSVYPPAEFLGARHGAELEPLLAAADLFVLPGTGGLAVQQAMAAGLPVIVAAGDGTQEDLVQPLTSLPQMRLDKPLEGRGGWLVPPDDRLTLERALEIALRDVEHLRVVGAQAYQIVRTEINLQAMVSGFVEAVNAIAALGLRSAG